MTEDDQSTNLITLYDALHGVIDLRKFAGDGKDNVSTLFSLLHCRSLDRLRRIKLLGYAAHRYTSADHSRYAHSVGTMYVAQMMLAHLETIGSLAIDYSAIAKAYKLADGHPKAAVAMHLYVAALMQDVGELPYSQATQHVFYPADKLRRAVQDSLGVNVRAFSNKDIFTLSCLLNESAIRKAGLNNSLLSYLITGHQALEKPAPGLRCLHKMLDGVVDADRLDYVFRDSYHTVGAKGSAKRVIDTLVRIDNDSVVFNETGAVMDFLITRAHLWNDVYLAPATRLRTLLLVVLTRELMTMDDLWPDSNGGALTIEDFLEHDDVSLTLRIAELTDDKKRRRLSNRGRRALDILMGNAPSYEYVWVPEPRTNIVNTATLPAVPDVIFVDRYSDYQNKPLYEHGSVLIEAPQFRVIGKSITLEECSGTFGHLLDGLWTGIERPDHMAVYRPTDTELMNTLFSESFDEEGVRSSLWRSDILSALRVPSDTRKHAGFSGPDLFVSFTWANKEMVDSVLQALYERRQRYFALADSWSGLDGSTPVTNSIAVVQQAEAILAIVSLEYAKRISDRPSEGLANEWYEMCTRKTSEDIPLILISADKHTEVNLPLAPLKLLQPPFMGVPLRDANADVIGNAVDAVIKAIA